MISNAVYQAKQYCPFKFRLSPLNRHLKLNSINAILTYDLHSNCEERDLMLISENDLSKDSLTRDETEAFEKFKLELMAAAGGNVVRFKNAVVGHFDQPRTGQAVAIYRFGPVPVLELNSIEITDPEIQSARSVRVGLMPVLSSNQLKQNPEDVVPLLLKSYGLRFDRLMDKYFEDVASKFQTIRNSSDLLTGFLPAWRSEVTLSASLGTKLNEISKALKIKHASKSRMEVDAIQDAYEQELIEASFGQILGFYLLNQFYQRVGKADRCAYYENKWHECVDEWRKHFGTNWEGPTIWIQKTFDLSRTAVSPEEFSSLLNDLSTGSWQAEFVAFAQFLAGSQALVYTEKEIPKFILGLMVSLKPEEKRAIALCLKNAANKKSKAELINLIRAEYQILVKSNGASLSKWSELKAEQKKIEKELRRLYIVALGAGNERRMELADSLFVEVKKILQEQHGMNVTSMQLTCLRTSIHDWIQNVKLVRKFSKFYRSSRTIITDLEIDRTASETLRDRIAVGVVPFNEEQIDHAVDHLTMGFAGCLNLSALNEPIPSAEEFAGCFQRAYENCEIARKQSVEKLIKRWRELSPSARKGSNSPVAKKLFDKAYTKLERHKVNLNDELVPLLVKENINGRLYFTSNIQRVIANQCQNLDAEGIRQVENIILSVLIA